MTGKPRRVQVLIAVLVVAVSVLVNAPQSFAQTVTGSILGTVRDPQGAVVPNASISAKNLETGAERTAVSDSSGGFSIVSLPAGSYEVTASAPGFQTEVRSGITLTVGAAQRMDFTMRVGAVSEKVEVTAEAPQVDTTTSTMAGLVGETVVRELPLNGRDWLQLGLLQAGVAQVMSQIQDTSSGVHYGMGVKMSISGGRSSQNVFRVDGLVVNDHTNNSPGSVLGGNMGVDAIREFSVLTNTYSAEYGRSSGGVINAITKSGTNTLHGTAFEFLRNSAMDARNFFDTQLPPFRRNQFGGSIGGPIKKDKLFFFANYEGLREFKSLSFVSNTLSPNARNGILCANAACTSTTTVTIDPRVKPYFPLYPQPNGPIIGDTGQLIFGAGRLNSEYYVIGKIDYQLSPNTTVNGSFTLDHGNSDTPDAFNEKLSAGYSRIGRVNLSLQRVFSPTMINTVRGGFNRVVAGFADVSPSTPLLTDPSLGFRPGVPMGTIGVTGLSGIGGIGSTRNDLYWYTSPQFSDDLGWVKGRNNIRIGFSVEAIRNNFYSPNAPLGGWTFNTIGDFLTVRPFSFAGDFPDTDSYRGLREKVFGAYIQDDFRFRPNLTVNIGVRYEPTTTIREINGIVASIHNVADPLPVVGNPVYQNPTLRNFSPRFGLAWDPTGNGKTAIRAGFGIFNVLPLPNIYATDFIRSVPFFKQGVAQLPPAASFPNQIYPLLTNDTLRTQFIEFNPRPAYKMQWNLNIQRQITSGLSIMAGYVGSRGVHLPLDADDTDMVPPSLTTVAPNGHIQFPVPQAPKVNPNYGKIRAKTWNAWSSYHSLQVNVAEKIRNAFTVQGTYQWSKNIDIGSSEGSIPELSNAAQPIYPFNFGLDRSVSNFDVTQQVSINTVWEAPSPHSGMAVSRFLLSGWELSGIFTARSGTPFTVADSGDRALTGSSQGGQRPDFKPGPGCSRPSEAVNPGNINLYVNMSCFSFPALGQFGNLSRNALRAPAMQNFDFALFKNNNLLGEKLKVQFRAEFFNLFNRANFGGQNATIFGGTGQLVPVNAALRTTVTTSRQIQFGVKFIW